MSGTTSYKQEAKPRSTAAVPDVSGLLNGVAGASCKKVSFVYSFLDVIDNIFREKNTNYGVVDDWVIVEEPEKETKTVKELEKHMSKKTCPLLLAEAKKEVEEFDGVA